MPKTKKQSTDKRKRKIKEAVQHCRSKESKTVVSLPISNLNVTSSANTSQNQPLSTHQYLTSTMTYGNWTPFPTTPQIRTPSVIVTQIETPLLRISSNIAQSTVTLSRDCKYSAMPFGKLSPSMIACTNVLSTAMQRKHTSTLSFTESQVKTPSIKQTETETPLSRISPNVASSTTTLSRDGKYSAMPFGKLSPSMLVCQDLLPPTAIQTSTVSVKDKCNTNFNMIQYWNMQEHLQEQQSKTLETSSKSYNTEWRARRRNDAEFRQKEQSKDTERRSKTRHNSIFANDERHKNTKWRKKRRKDYDIREAEQSQDTSRRQKRRLDPKLKEQEQTENTKWRQTKRKDFDIREAEQSQDTSRRQKRRLDPKLKEQEQTENTKWRQKKRKDFDIREAEQSQDTSRRHKRRLDPKLKEQEQTENTKWRQTKRKDFDIREAEQSQDTSRRQKRRLDPKLKEQEQTENTKWRQKKRKDFDIREAEQSQDTSRRQKRRLDPKLKEQEQTENTNWRQKKRKDFDIREAEQSQDTFRRKKRRLDPKLKEQEQTENTKWRQKRRNDPAKKQQDNVKKASSRERQRQMAQTSTVSDMVKSFHKQVEDGPTFICSSCHQLWYKHSVVSISSTTLPPCKAVQECLPDCINPYCLCRTCLKYLRDKKFPPCSIVNGMAFPTEPEDLKDLHKLEWRLLSPRIAFMKIFEAPRGGQYKIHGNVVNVPTDVLTTHTSLPRLQNEDATIKVKLKRHLKYKNHVLSENVRPEKVRRAAKYLSSNSPLFKEEGIVFNTSWEPEDTTSDTTVSENSTPASAQEGYSSPNAQPDIQPVLHSANSSSTQSADDDNWSEPEDNQDEMPGDMNTMLTSPDFLEDHERDLLFTVAPGQNSTPVSIFRDKYSEELAFPNIFFGQKRPQNSNRHVPIYYSELCKSEARRADRRLVKDVDNLFFKAKKLQMKQMLDKVQIALRKCKSSGLTLNAKAFKERDNIQDFVFKDIAYKFLNTIRGSPPYFQAINKDLFAMIRQLGPATFFASFSAAETRWAHLLRILAKVVDNKDLGDEEIENLTWQEKCRLIQSDPVTVTRHFHHQVQRFFAFLQSDFNPIGELVDYFWRLEFQQRGSAHIHCLFWIKDSPKLDTDSHEDIIKYIDSILTCHKPTEEEDKELADLVKYQIHRHSHTCRKGKRTCRFHYPLPPMKSTQMLMPLQGDEILEKRKYDDMWETIKTELNSMKMGEDITFEEFLTRLQMPYEDYIMAIRSTIKDISIFLKRTPSEIRVNQYSLVLLKAWRANIDIQFVINVYVCASYIASYVTKAQRGMSQILRKATQEAKETHGESIRQQFRQVANRFVNSVEICAQEAATLILQLPMRRSSRVTVFVNTNLPDDRVFLLKPQHVLMNMDDDDENIESSSLITKYEQRPDDLESVTLAEFACFYTLKTKYTSSRNQTIAKQTVDGYLPETDLYETRTDDESEDTFQEFAKLNEPCVDQLLENSSALRQKDPSNKIYTKRKIPRILRYCRFSKDKEPEKYFRELIMLYTAWRNERIDLIQGFQTYQQKFQECQDSIHLVQQLFEPFSEQVDLAAQNLQTEQQPQDEWDQLATNTEHQEAIDADLVQLHATQQPEIYDFADDLGLRVQTEQSKLQSYHEMPDAEFREKMQKLNQEQMEFLYDVLHHSKTSQEPIYYFLSGGAGVGKTFVSNLLFQALIKFLNKEAGMDPDKPRVLLIAPTGKAAYLMKGQTIHSALRLPVSQKLQFTSLNTDSLNTLRTSMQQVRYIFIDEVSMVGSSMLNFIHKRLQEVTGSAKDFGGISIIAIGDLFQLKPVCDAYMFENATTAYSPLADNLWKKHFRLFELNQIMRQDNGSEFAKMLNRMREGQQTVQDVDLLNSRTVSKCSPLYQTLSDFPHLFLKNESVESHNHEKFLSSQNEKREIRAKDTVVSSATSALEEAILNRIPDDPRKTMQLHSILKLAVNLHYDLSLNVRTDDGLTNGASCVVKKIETAENGQASGIVWVHFSDKDVGQKTREEHKALFRGLHDKQWTPIIPITKRFNVGKNAEVTRTQFPLRPSSAKTVHRAQGDTLRHVVADFKGRCEAHIHYVACSRVQTIDDLYLMNLEPNKIKVSDKVQNEMIRLRSQPFTPSLTQLYNVTADFKLVFHNTQSLNKHILDVQHDFNLQAADVFFCAETRFINTDTAADTDIAGFQSFRNDSTMTARSRPFHGLAAYYNAEKVALQPSAVNYKKVEIISCKVMLKSSTEMLVIGLYNPPRSPVQDVINALFSIFKSQSPSLIQTIVVGDFNIDLTKDSADKKKLLDFFDTYNLQECIHPIPTTDLQTTIDHIYTNVPNTSSGVLESYYSYHKAVWIAVNRQ